MKYFYVLSTNGALVIRGKGDFPLTAAHKQLMNIAGEPIFIVFWSEISKAEYEDFTAFMESIAGIGPETSGPAKETPGGAPDDSNSSHH